jgi:hypothetical protein
MLESRPSSMFSQRRVCLSRVEFFAQSIHHTFVLDLGKAANFPYATINPEEARVLVPDARFDWLCDAYKPASRVPAVLTCIDIAGLTAVRLSSFPFSILKKADHDTRVPQPVQVSAMLSCPMSVLSMEFSRLSERLMTQKSSMSREKSTQSVIWK